MRSCPALEHRSLACSGPCAEFAGGVVVDYEDLIRAALAAVSRTLASADRSRIEKIAPLRSPVRRRDGATHRSTKPREIARPRPVGTHPVSLLRPIELVKIFSNSCAGIPSPRR